MPAVIAEIAYLSNASDRELLKQAEFRQKAQALVDSVFEALEVMEAEKDEDGVWKIKNSFCFSAVVASFGYMVYNKRIKNLS